MKRPPLRPGDRFGRLTVLRAVGKQVECRCDCGNTKMAWSGNLVKGWTVSCGCLPGNQKDRVGGRCLLQQHWRGNEAIKR